MPSIDNRKLTIVNERERMYEDYYGLLEKPFILTPDPKYLYARQRL